ncbi:uroporphyrinogen-III C-methyltransferase [Saccharibacillus alkalitolerans]|uniref:uroporphyrinogen-III C-methyltransferase n=1 Tax=Saccharibacillus alkalitolerans TaxID=2705290 RepID=A0ABX0F8T0_9BACL|nr:uroporphyrinogen-III C-methyltransferase [Saccharibacillus alkalitolerans]NGZ77282.1 uroporphyrinogen-III C-methyltransferase [Saccharibacillus alkalitolerans]
MSRGRISIVGAGPGDPELITVKALRRLEQADVVLYDRLVSDELLEHCPPGTLKIYCGKAPGRHALTQEEIDRLIVDYARVGHHVVRLKGGDPFVFGRGGEEALAASKAGIPFEVVPGVTSAAGASASAGIPLTHRGTAASFAVVTGSRCGDDGAPVRWDLLAQGADTLAVYMGVARLEEICGELIRYGRGADTPAALVENATTEAERVVTGTLGNIARLAAAMKVGSPAMLLVGDTVGIREKLQPVVSERYGAV